MATHSKRNAGCARRGLAALAFAWLAAGLVAGCSSAERGTDGGGFDSGLGGPPDGGEDAGSGEDGGRDAEASADSGTDGGTDGGTDAGSDAGTEDAATGDDAGTGDDGGTVSITVDGTRDAGEWSAATTAFNTIDTDWGAGLNELDAVHALIEGARLYIAVEGTLETTNGIVLYVDANRGASDGICDLSTLSDGDGAVDDVVSAGLSTPSDVCVERALGVRTMDATASGFDDDLGWRDVTDTTSDFAWISADAAPVACGTGVCETSIPLTMLGASSGDTLALFVRIANAEGTSFSNQTLPQDDPDAPATVSEVLELAVP